MSAAAIASGTADPPRYAPNPGRRFLGLLTAACTAAWAAAALVLVFYLADVGMWHIAATGAALSTAGFWVLSALVLMVAFTMPALIGGAVWLVILDLIGEHHWAAYAAGGALIAGACTAAIFGLPLWWDPALDRLTFSVNAIFTLAGAAGGFACWRVERGRG